MPAHREQEKKKKTQNPCKILFSGSGTVQYPSSYVESPGGAFPAVSGSLGIAAHIHMIRCYFFNF